MFRKLFCLMLTGCCIACGGGAALAAHHISIGTNPVGMALYTMGAALSEVLRTDSPDIELTVEATNGGVHNLHLMASGDIEIGFTNPKEAMDAYAGVGRYKHKVPILGLFSSAIAYQQCPALADSHIRKVGEVRDKRIGVGPPGALSRVDTEVFLSAYGVTFKDFKAFSETLPEMVEKMKNGQLDATMWFGVSPLAPLMDLAQSRDIVWLEADAETLKPILEKAPYYFLSELPAGTYPKQNRPIPALAQRYDIVARADMPEELVYRITKATFSNLEKLGSIYKGWAHCGPETALQSMTIPLHPGAVRYFREINLPGLDDYLRKYPL
ncbi:TAXI family TRAP transporter solute-binding subunit [uncultured Bilophila sp.]|uniref:TAXI family TRAP transporter solute-binding subunit n=1 Tax=uncultured Bilophila sp. TaxID=529385 RepID=UPI0026DCD3A6|nr:TAXI family TRAP transporter solute-binding subunit [uncultured Bilophila sp.]